MLAIRPYQPAAHEEPIFGLWQATFEQTWPLTRDTFRRVTVGTPLSRKGDYFVAEDAGAYVGFVATQVDREASPPPIGHIGMLLVARARRRQGIGRALHASALAHLRQVSARRAQLGGGDAYLWPSVPSGERSAIALFRSCGWTYAETTYDLAQSLRDYVPRAAIHRRIAAQGIDVATAGPKSVVGALTFAARVFPSWEGAYRSVAALGDYADFVLARDKDGRIIGSSIVCPPRSHPPRIDVRWKTLLGEDAGAIGVVGAEPGRRPCPCGAGIGDPARSSGTSRFHRLDVEGRPVLRARLSRVAGVHDGPARVVLVVRQPRFEQ